jgi:hypothetical protein
MGKSSTPKYDENAAKASQEWAAQMQSKYGTYGVQSPLGTLQTVQNPDGTYSLSYGMDKSDQYRQSLINQGLASLSLDPTQAQNAYYSQATRNLLPQFQLDQDRLHEQLVNRGITAGSELYNNQMDLLRQNQNNQLANIADQSVWQGQNLLSTQIGNIGGLSSQYDILNVPGMSGSTGAQFQDTYSQKYNADLQRAQQKNAARNAMWSTAGSLVGGLGGALLGNPGLFGGGQGGTK